MADSSINVHRFNKFANFFLVFEDKQLTLIDTGSKIPVLELHDKFERAGYDLQQLDRIIITHSHYDHAGNAAILKKEAQAIVMAHEAEIPYLTHQERIPRPRGPGGWLFHATEPYFRAPPVEVDVVLRDGDTIEGTGFSVIHTPGHTPGSICLYHEKIKVLFTGDCILNPNDRLRGPISFFSSNIGRARKSVERLFDLSLRTIYFAHGKTMRDISPDELRRRLG